MKILMMTNTYTPMIGGIEQSIHSFKVAFEKMGHDVVIVAPECPDVPLDEVGVVRLRAIQNINHSHFSIALPLSKLLPELLKTFQPDIIHSHHPFWMGDIALRLSSKFRIPLVFTYHTMYEQHMHYLPLQHERIQRFIRELFLGYANLVSIVLVPSESVRDILLAQGVTTPLEVTPTGISAGKFARGDGAGIRRRLGIPPLARVIGYVGRLTLEKNLEFLSRCVAGYLAGEPDAHFVVCGGGPLGAMMQTVFDSQGVGTRLHFAGILQGQDLIDCYHAMNIFAFASLSETQGIVLIEAMAAGVPAVAVDAPGVREVIKDGYNGRLIYGEDVENFRKALDWCLKQPAADLRQMKINARVTSRRFDGMSCARKLFNAYQRAMSREYASPEVKNSSWYALSRQLKNEWDMFKNLMHAGGAAVVDMTSLSGPAQGKTAVFFRLVPRLLSLKEWSMRCLRRPQSDGTGTAPGLVLIQIDGLSRQQMENAFGQNKMPFLRGLLRKNYYHLHSHYSGLPSSTPAVQGELFYGIKQAVPAFAFWDKSYNKIFHMYDSEAALEIERRLALRGNGLLAGGSSYSNVYSGGARQSHFCATALGWNAIWKEMHIGRMVLLAVTHIPTVIRMVALVIVELFLGIIDFGRGVARGKNALKAFNFIYLRVLICILLRELVAFGVRLDIARGVPVIHLNLLGYDELAHNHGPSSPSAQWSLRGIDRALEKMYRQALHARRRSYDVWIYSDHGQQPAVSYIMKYKRRVEEVIAEIYREFDETAGLFPVLDNTGEQLQRARLIGPAQRKKNNGNKSIASSDSGVEKLIVTAIGPTGNIYLPRTLNREQLRRFAWRLVREAHIPVLMIPQENDMVCVLRQDGEFRLPGDAGAVFGADHPFLASVTEDLIGMCHHPNAGDLTFMGFIPGETVLTFPLEIGAHAGPGPEETHGFVVLPADIVFPERKHRYVTPTDVRGAAMRLLKRSVYSECKPRGEIINPREKTAMPAHIRIMTYNVHSCIGTDKKIYPARIARVIGRHRPDIIALQELDRGRKRTGAVDQPHLIARQLEMFCHFYPVMVVNGQDYGNAVLSRYPMELIRVGRLPTGPIALTGEPRGALWIVITIAGNKINFFNAHLGYLPGEGMRQVKSLLGSEWIAHSACQGSVVVCGDFNALPNSPVCRALKGVLRDAQEEVNRHNFKATWFGHYPIGRIDHVFVSSDITVRQAIVPRSDLDILASDHLPLIVDITVPGSHNRS